MDNILYQSTRGSARKVTASEAILRGLAEDGGLYVPERIPDLPASPEELSRLSYRELSYEILSRYLTDYSEADLKRCIDSAYDSKFDDPQIAPLHATAGAAYLELYHGSTIAFKDMALSILPYLMTTAAKMNRDDHQIVILTATSGDTGKAALAGFADVPGTKIIVFYPKHGVSRIQELQMVTQTGENTCVAGIEGNFDDAQTGVKQIFSDRELNERLDAAGSRLSSANSINIGRLVPQIVYYIYGYGQMLRQGLVTPDRPIDVTVPTGNFGNILAAWYARAMGLPIRHLICASNENRVLYDFFGTGAYDRNREFYVTSSPSMDILVSSNLERLLYLTDGCNPDGVRMRMQQLQETGRYTISDEMRRGMEMFRAGYATQEQTALEIGRVWREYGYLIDPHTAVASYVCRQSGGEVPQLIVSTASPYKFPRAVLEAIGTAAEGTEDLKLSSLLSGKTGTVVPEAVRSLEGAPIRHERVIDPAAMKILVEKEIL